MALSMTHFTWEIVLGMLTQKPTRTVGHVYVGEEIRDDTFWTVHSTDK